MRSFVFASILSALVFASPVAAAEDTVVVVLQAPKGLLDAERTRAAIGRELHATAVPPEDTRAKDARGRLTIAGSSASSVTVTYRRLKNGENDASSPAIVRAVTLPPEPARAESTVTILASNLARDEAGELLGGLKAPPQPPTRSTPDAVTSLVNRHREAKKKTALSQIDESLAFEQKELVKAREVAIQRLETLVATYATRAPANEMADAMFRLAALYEERAQAAADKVALETGLRAAIILYQRIVRDFPSYRERAAVHYYLGHALNDVGELRDAQVAWRSLVCANHFTYQSTPAKRGPAAMPGDADEAYWASWRRRYATPASIAKSNPETVYVEVFPEDCAPIASGRSDASRYVVEAWWQIGSSEFDQLDAASGATREMPTTVWGYNRAASAFERGLHSFAAPGAQASPIHAALLYKYAWTLFKQQRYELATKTFVKLLEQTDAQQGGADFHDEAVTYIAGALTSADFRGPEAWAPFIPRLEEPAREREASRSAVRPIDRLKALVPQDKPWTIDVYRALAVELRGLDQHADAAFALEVIAQRWPLDRSAPETQKAIADTWDQALASAKQGSPEHAHIAEAALKARRKLAAYAGATAWTNAHKDEPLLLRRGEGIARAALHETGARHTNAARALLDAKKVAEAIAEYDLAADAWQALADITPTKGPPPAEIDDARYWLADALHQRVRLRVSLREVDVRSPEPSRADIERAVAAARAAQGSPADAAHRENSAMFVVDLRDVDRDLAYLHARETSGAHGVARRDEVRFDSADPVVRRPVKDNVPDVVRRSIDAREEYIRAGGARSIEYAYWIAETLFLYGQWDQARPRLETLWRSRCAVDGVGFKAWSRLATMAAAERDVARVLFLAEAVDPKRGGKSCDADGETRVVDPMRRAALQTRAQKRFEELCSASPCRPPETPAKKTEWIEVGVLFEQALAASIADDEAPRLALSGAYAFKLGGQPARGIPLCEKAIAEHAARANGPKALGDVYGALASAYVALFDYARAADTYAKLAERGGSVAEETRRDAARNAMILFASLRARADMDRMHELLARLHPSSDTQAAADFLVAMYDLENQDKARSSAASAALVKFFDANRTNAAAAKYLTEAAWSIATWKRADGDRRGAKPWLTRTIEARDRARALGQIDPEADRLAAGAAFELLDEEITASFDAPGHHTYPKSAAEVFERYRLRAEEAKRWSDRLEREVITKYASREWTVAAWARQGALFDTLRSGLYFNTTATKGLDDKGEALVRALRAAHRDEAADKLEDTARDVWQQRRQKELDAADALLIDRYAKAVFTAKKLDMTSAPVARARARLFYFTEMLGEPIVQKHVENTVDPTSSANAMLRYEQGMFASGGKGSLGAPMTAPDSDPKPLPAVP